MTKAQLTEQQVAHGCRKFLDMHPAAVVRIDAITPELAAALGVNLDDYRRVETMKELTAAATQLDIDSFEYFLGFAVDSAHERERLLDARTEAIKTALGL